MLKLYFLILVNIIFLCCGCGKILHKSVDLKDNDPAACTNSIDPALLYDNSASPAGQSFSENCVVSKDSDAPDSTAFLKEAGIPASGGNGLENKQIALDAALDYCQVAQELWQKGDFENAVESLDQAYSLILNIDNDENPKLIQQRDDLRFMISKRILEIYASRNIIVNGNHNEIPLVMNKHVQKEIDHFTKNREKSFFIDSYKRSGKYRPYILAELEKAGLPLELSWLPLIESGFKVNAFSKARALGLWQFIPSTGYKFGLKRNIYIDERLDPYKSTRSAIQYLKQLHQIFGDWATVLAAYNCGEGRVLRVIRGQNINYLDNFWDLYERLPRETARYVPRFLAVLHIIKNKEKYGFDSVKPDDPLHSETVVVSRQMHLKSIAKSLAVPTSTLTSLNPELRYNILPDEDYPLRIPAGKRGLLLSKLDGIPIASIPRKAFVYHRIRPGESLSTIARRYRTSVGRIARANNIYKRSVIIAGKVLKIPQRGTVVPKTKRYRTQKYGKAVKHIVQSGDSLWIIANKYCITTKKIMALNNLKSTRLRIGQILMVPERKKKAIAAKQKTGQYLVKNGDSPYTIAQAHNLPLKRLLRLNNLEPRNKIYPGQYLVVE